MDAEHGGVCPYDGGPAMPMGRLGNRMHYRCRNCGMDSSRKIDNKFQDYLDVDNYVSGARDPEADTD